MKVRFSLCAILGRPGARSRESWGLGWGQLTESLSRVPKTYAGRSQARCRELRRQFYSRGRNGRSFAGRIPYPRPHAVALDRLAASFILTPSLRGRTIPTSKLPRKILPSSRQSRRAFSNFDNSDSTRGPCEAYLLRRPV